MGKFSKRIIDLLIISIPLLIMVLLAVASWWLLLLTPAPQKIVEKKVFQEGVPDLMVNQFMMERFDASGALRSRMTGTNAQRFPFDDSILIHQVDLTSTESTLKEESNAPVLGTEGVQFFRVTAIADRGYIFNEQDIIELQKNAFVTRQPLDAIGDRDRVEFRGDELRILTDQELITSDLPVDIRNNGSRYLSEKMIYHSAQDRIEMIGKVKTLTVLEK